MNTITGNENAFPLNPAQNDKECGLSIVQEFASRNMAALIGKYNLKTPEDQKTVAQLSVELAWELVAALNK